MFGNAAFRKVWIAEFNVWINYVKKKEDIPTSHTTFHISWNCSSLECRKDLEGNLQNLMTYCSYHPIKKLELKLYLSSGQPFIESHIYLFYYISPDADKQLWSPEYCVYWHTPFSKTPSFKCCIFSFLIMLLSWEEKDKLHSGRVTAGQRKIKINIVKNRDNKDGDCIVSVKNCPALLVHSTVCVCVYN